MRIYFLPLLFLHAPSILVEHFSLLHLYEKKNHQTYKIFRYSATLQMITILLTAKNIKINKQKKHTK